MSGWIIKAEGLGKRYNIKHQADGQRYVALRDVIADKAMAPMRWLGLQARGHKLTVAQLPTVGNPVSELARAEEFWALKDISFEIEPGEVVGIIGRNGAGKSTLLKILSRITEPTEGRVSIRGRVASLLEVGTGFHPELTGRENIFLNGAILGMTRAEIRKKFDEIVAFADVEKFLDTPVKRYSSGMHVRLAFSVAAHLEPDILIVDEVLAVGDAQFQAKCLGKMKDVAHSGRTILFVSHQMAAIENLCDTGLLLEGGRVKVSGTARNVIAAYASYGGAPQRQSLIDRHDRRGSGVLRFSEIRIVDDNGESLESLVCGGSAAIELQVCNYSSGPLRQLHISIGVENTLGQRVTTWSTSYSGGDFPATPAEDFAVRVRLPRLALLPGTYTYYLFATVNGDVADWLLPAGSFSVEAGDYYGSGKVPGNRDGVFISDHAFDLIP